MTQLFKDFVANIQNEFSMGLITPTEALCQYYIGAIESNENVSIGLYHKFLELQKKHEEEMRELFHETMEIF